APPDCQSSAAVNGSPYEVSEPASPWTSRTACPSATSTAGRRTRRSAMGFLPVGREGAGIRVRDEDQEREPSQLRSSCAPASPDFSGWNGVADSGPFSTAATKRPPWSDHVTRGGAKRVSAG